jgi:glycosidase
VDRVSLRWPHNDRPLARDCPERDGDDWVCTVRVPPGRHGFSFVANDDPSNEHWDEVTVPGPGRPRVSLSATVVGGDGDAEEVRIAADAAAPPDLDDEGDAGRTGGESPVAVDFLVDDRDAPPETVARIESLAAGDTLAIPVAELPADLAGGIRIHAVPHGDRYGAAETVRIERDESGVVTVSDPHAPPAWADSPTIYEVFVRSFAGDTLPTTFREIERRVPYVESLGVDALWLTPVLASPTEHGYHVTDYYDTAADLGSREAFESLVDACHDAGIRVIFDLVVNHTSRDHPAFQMHAAGVDDYADYYRRADGAFDVTGTDWAELAEGDMPEYYFNWRRIPNLNFDSPAVREWLLDVVDEWSAVVDGFRADVAWGVPHGFWKEVGERVPDDFLLLDETLPHDPFYGEGEFDLHYDTSLYDVLRTVGAGDAPADAVADAFARAEWLGFDDPSLQMRYVENHDEERYLAEYGRAALKAAAAATFTLPGAPMVYAGQERGNETYRGPIRWHDGDNDLTDFHRDLAALREREPILQDGAVDFQGRAADVSVVDGDPERLTAYERVPPSGGSEDDGGERDGGEDDGGEGNGEEGDGEEGDPLLVVVNFADAPATVTVPAAFETDLFARNDDGEPDDGESDDNEPIDGTVTVESVVVLR